MRFLEFGGSARADHGAAERERAVFEEIRKTVSPNTPMSHNPAGPLLSLASELLSARIAGDAVSHLRCAVEIQDAFVYDEPPAWYYPVRESLGAALLREGKAPEAEMVFREGVRRSPRNGRMLFGLMESLKALGRGEEAGMVRKEFEAAWAKADLQLSIGDL